MTPPAPAASVAPFGARGALVSVPDAATARRTADTLRALLSGRATSVVPGAETVLVHGSPTLEGASLVAAVDAALAEAGDAATPDTSRTVVIPVRYDGDDLAGVAALLGVSVEEVITRHTNPDYTVDFLGFAPGFPYLSGLDPFLAEVPRLDSPRTRVPAGSVGLAAGKTCVYPTPSPGGWRLLGSTSLRLFDPSDAASPSTLRPGDRVRFRVGR